MLFNVYHDAVMQDFRKRREKEAKRYKEEPGLKWHYKIDGKLARSNVAKGKEVGTVGVQQEVRTTVIGDVGFADDTAILGMEKETRRAGRILVETLTDWDERINLGKTEHLRLSGEGRKKYDVRGRGELSTVRQVGGWPSEDGKH